MSLPVPQRPTARRSSLAAALVAAGALAAASASSTAAPLITFTDTANSAAAGGVNDSLTNWAVSWTQARGTTGVTLSALLSANVPGASVDWWVTTRIGPGTTAADIVYAGSTAVADLPGGYIDFDPLPRTTLGTGLSFGAGTYYLVLDGPAAGSLQNPVDWIGDTSNGAQVDLDPDFTLGRYLVAQDDDTPGIAAFAPASGFVAPVFTGRFVFELNDGAVPVPVVGTAPLVLTALAALVALVAPAPLSGVRRRAG